MRLQDKGTGGGEDRRPPPPAEPSPGEVRTVVTLYGYELLAGYVSDVRAGQTDKIIAVAFVLIAFFSPVATMWVREPLRSGAQFLLTFPACYFLGIMTFFAKPLYGGMLALSCWAVLLKLSSDTLWASFRARKRRTS